MVGLLFGLFIPSPCPLPPLEGIICAITIGSPWCSATTSVLQGAGGATIGVATPTPPSNGADTVCSVFCLERRSGERRRVRPIAIQTFFCEIEMKTRFSLSVQTVETEILSKREVRKVAQERRRTTLLISIQD